MTPQDRTHAFARTRSERLFDVVNVTLIGLFLIVIIYPLWYVFVASFSDIKELLREPMVLWPKGLTFDAYDRILTTPVIWSGFRNSLIYMVGGVTLNVLLTVLAAYPLSRKDLRGRKTILKILVVTLYLSGGLIPTYLVVRSLGMLDTFWAMVAPNAVNAFMIIIARSFFETAVPNEMQEAGRIDGCSNFQLLIRVVLPVSTPLVTFLALSYGIGHWNSYVQALIFLTSRDRFPLQLILREILIAADSVTVATMLSDRIDYDLQIRIREGIKYVSMVVSSAPLLIIFPFMRKAFERGITLGAVKG